MTVSGFDRITRAYQSSTRRRLHIRNRAEVFEQCSLIFRTGAAFVSLCENFLGCRPHWGLFKHIFTCRSQTLKKANTNDERAQVIQMCGGLGVQMRSKSAFPAMTLPESVRGWQSTWFYCQDQPMPGQSTGLPPFSMSRVNKPSSLKVVSEEKAQVKMLMERVVQLI